MTITTAEITQHLGVHWPFFLAQAVNSLIIIGPFVLAARAILSKGRGWEVPVWLILSFCIPIVFPVLALIHFRKSKVVATQPNLS